MNLLTPTEIENAARDIITYYDKSTAPHDDKVRILSMLREHYETTDATVVDRWFAALLQRVVDKHAPQTSFEKE